MKCSEHHKLGFWGFEVSVYRLGKKRRDGNASDQGLVGNSWEEALYPTYFQANWQIVGRWGNKENGRKLSEGTCFLFLSEDSVKQTSKSSKFPWNNMLIKKLVT